MAEIRPFCGVHYKASLLQDWSAVLCPVYDIISPQFQEELYLRSEYNFVRLESALELPQDTATDNKYTRSVTTLERWLKEGILEVAARPAIYLHDQYFVYQGREYKRRGLIARVKVEEWEKMVIRPHEGTLTEPKTDRLSLLWALAANTSPILSLYEDERKQMSSLFAFQEQRKPLFNLKKINGEGHVVWALTEPKVVEQISRYLAERPLYIADGHHRYESALAYQREKRALSPLVSGNEAYHSVMMTLVDFADPGLVILPPHRLVRGISKSMLKDLLPELKVFFEIEELPLNVPGVWERAEPLLAERDGVRLVLVGLVAETLLVLKLRDSADIDQMIPYFHSELYRKLDVCVVDHVILEKLLALDSDRERSSIAYSYDRLEAVNRVLDQEYQLAFLLRAVKAEVIKAVADSGDRMPRKSTYFYPKPPAGLVFNRLI